MQTLFQLPEPRNEFLNPMVRIYGQAESGLKCKACKHLNRIQHTKTKSWFKCGLRRSGGPATDHRANWQACKRFVGLDPSCKGCKAKRLDNCIC